MNDGESSSIDNLDYTISLLTQLMDIRKRNAELEAQIRARNAQIKEKEDFLKENMEKILLAESVADSDTYILISDMAKILNQDGYRTDEDRFPVQLNKDGYLTKDGMPSHRSMELKIMRIVEYVIIDSRGSFAKRIAKITPKGQIYFRKKYLGKKRD